ncbi:MAG: hypothetical protein HC852_15485 [Acaryochloridaceae cyanobacterium RU_4_10]|nr:hypothetical protein [Acaryochloridaceae cyanobacterium RU_4_10]
MNSIANNDSNPHIDFKSAIESAYGFLGQVKKNMGENLSDIRLEEVQLSDDRKQWLITLGYDVSVPTENTDRLDKFSEISVLRPKTSKREYKIFGVNATTGRVEFMKIRSV